MFTENEETGSAGLSTDTHTQTHTQTGRHTDMTNSMIVAHPTVYSCTWQLFLQIAPLSILGTSTLSFRLPKNANPKHLSVFT